MDLAQEIKDKINMYQILDSYGYEMNRHKKMCCPFHTDNTPSFGIYNQGKSFKCFGCGANGDVIAFVRQSENCDFKKAIEIIDNRFGLMLLEKPTLTQKRKMDEEIRRREKEKQLRQEQREYTNFAYNRLCEYCRWLRKQPETKDILHDIAFMERLLEKYLDRDSIIDFDVLALISALLTKFYKANEVEDVATESDTTG